MRQRLESPQIDLPNTIDPKTGKGYGLYKMTLNGSDFVDVPYNKVMDASKSGFKIRKEDRETFASDRMADMAKHPKNGRFLTEGEFRSMELPEVAGTEQGATPEFWNSIRQYISDLGAPRENQTWRNFARRVGANLFGIADFPVQASGALIDSLSNQPDVSLAGQEQLVHMMPNVMVADRIKEFKEEWAKNKNNAMNNLTADAFALFLAHKIGSKAGGVGDMIRGNEAGRTFARSQLGMPERIEAEVKKFGNESDAARAELKAARQNTAQDNLETVRKHEELKQKIAAENDAAVARDKKRLDTKRNSMPRPKNLTIKSQLLRKSEGRERCCVESVAR